MALRKTILLALATGLAGFAILGCGSRTALDPGDEPDDPGDGGLDAGVDAEPPPDIEALCGRMDRYTSPRRSITLTAEARSTDPIVRQGWTLVTSPPGSTAMPAPTAGATTSLTPDAVGDYRLRFTVEDARARTASCEVVVHSVVGPPVAICPEEEELRVPVARSLRVEGDGYDDDAVATYLWRIVEAPPSSMPQLVPADAPVTDFLTDVPGRYLLRLTVSDIDGATDSCDVVVRVTAPPIVMCPGEEIVAPTRRETVIRATATDDTGIASMRWEVLERPAGSMAEPSPLDAETTRFTPDVAGLYRFAFTATDGDGLSSTCEVIVRATPTPPDAVCPPEIRTTPLTTVDVMGNGVDDGTIVGWQWALVSQPAASSADDPAPPNARMTRFTPDVAGDYVLQLTVTDDTGETDTCDVRVRAIPSEGLRVEVFWNAPDRSCDELGTRPCDDSDVDTHLLRPGTETWFNSAGDCHYANCISARGAILEWGAPGPDDNPHLDLDDVEGFGPENINVDRPQPGTYRVGVHLYDGADIGRASVTVNIYCGTRSMPDRTFGPVLLNEAGTSAANPFWRVADVEITGGACRITDLASGGVPNVTTRYEAERTR